MMILRLRFALAGFLILAVALATGPVQASKSNLPSLYMGYVFTTHHTPLLVAAIKGVDFKDGGAYLTPIVPKQKYQLVSSQGKPLAVINLIVSKSGSETATLFAMNRMDMGLSSSTAFMSGIDKGTPMKILFPLHVDGMSMVFPSGSSINGYADVEQVIKASATPFKIGYHSPTSAPRVVFEGALHKAGFKITGNPNDTDADILMVDLKSTSNLIPSLLNGQVDCWVGPAPHPSVAEHKNVGHIGLNSRELPPDGEWVDFPCCVMGASDRMIAQHPQIVQALSDLMTDAAQWSNINKKEAAAISADWIGVPAAAIENSSIVYTTNPTANWLKGEEVFLSMLNTMNKFKSQIKDKNMEAATPILYDFSFINKSLAR